MSPFQREQIAKCFSIITIVVVNNVTQAKTTLSVVCYGICMSPLSPEAANGNRAAPYCFQSRGFPISREHSTGGGVCSSGRPAPRNATRPISASLSGVIPFKHTATKRGRRIRGGHVRGTLTESVSWQPLRSVLFYCEDQLHSENRNGLDFCSKGDLISSNRVVVVFFVVRLTRCKNTIFRQSCTKLCFCLLMW